ncbi:MAG TPA: crotonase/enoyl-CoA hydratase family protein [Acidimicrobiales bacterium]|jgi:enoyl-CoA hydratase/carnithine racemase|nr:crotonase/enoyl-CoA hydratase family protein [Acidimicrobiales bacterium]
MAYEQLSTEVRDGVLTITLDRPDRLNAFTATMATELIDAFDRADADDEVRAVIVTGRGRAFCAGADLSGGPDAFDHRREGDRGVRRDGGGKVSLRIYDLTKPIIAAINGPAVGVGITMCLPMDLRLAAEGAKMGFVFTRRGITPEACSSWFLPRLVGMARAAEWVYTGRVFPAAEAAAGGLVSRVLAPEDLVPEARRLAREMAEGTSPTAVALARRMLWRMLGARHPMEAHRAESRAIAAMGASADGHEGVASFLERRQPQFPRRVSEGLPEVFPDWEEPAWG